MIGELPAAPVTTVLGSDQMSVRISWLAPPGRSMKSTSTSKNSNAFRRVRLSHLVAFRFRCLLLRLLAIGRGLPIQGYRVYVDGQLAYDGATDPVTREWLG